MSKTYTIEEVRVIYKAGKANIPLEDLLQTMAWLDRDLAKTPKSAAIKSRGVKKTKATRRIKGKLSDQIVAYLKTQGAKGAHLKDIAAAVNSKVQNVTAWFYTTGKKLIKAKSIKKTAPATFAFVEKT